MMIGVFALVALVGAIIVVMSIDAAAAGDKTAVKLYLLGCALTLSAIIATAIAATTVYK